MAGFYPTGAEATGGTTPTIYMQQPVTPTVTGVSISPVSVSLAGGAQQQFAAAVSGANKPSQAVTWSTSAGTISSAGLFTAPAATGSQQNIIITATSQADGTKSGTASITIAAVSVPPQPTVSGVAVSPSLVALAPGQQQQFSATVSGTNSPAQTVTWAKSGGGTLTAAGLFTAPAATDADQSILIFATSVQDGKYSGQATATVAAAAPSGGVHTVAVTVLAIDQQGNPLVGAPIQVELDQMDVDSIYGFVLPELIIGEADETGRAMFRLWPNVLGSTGSKYRFKITNPDTGKTMTRYALVPDEDCYLHQIALFTLH